MTSRDARIALALGVGALLVLAFTAEHGFVRDEGYYFRAARQYHGWFEELWTNLWAGHPWTSFGDANVRRHFGYNTEHPGLAKLTMGWTWKLFHRWLGWTSHATGYRLGSMLWFSLGVAFTYIIGARWFSRPVGLGAAFLLMVCPHVFYHAHLACFDGPILGVTAVVVYGFWRSLRSRRWMLATAVAWGCAIAIKHNAVFLGPTLALAWILANRRDLRLVSGMRLSLGTLPTVLWVMLLVGPVVFYIFYPYGWHAPIERIGAYYGYHLHHEHYTVDYFGTLQVQPPFPWSFPYVMTALTVPVVILLPGVVGWMTMVIRAVREEDALVPWLLVLNVLIPVAIISVPTVPIFGGTKHWMTMMPFLSVLSAWVLWEALTYLKDRLGGLRGVATAGTVGCLCLALPLVETARTYPLGHTYYSELVAGHPGGATLGMARTFWGGDGRELLGYLNEHAEPGAGIFTDRMNHDSFVAYQRDGLIRADLHLVREPRQSSWAFINHQREYAENEYKVWSAYGTKAPVRSVTFDGVPIVSLYRHLPP